MYMLRWEAGSLWGTYFYTKNIFAVVMLSRIHLPLSLGLTSLDMFLNNLYVSPFNATKNIAKLTA